MKPSVRRIAMRVLQRASPRWEGASPAPGPDSSTSQFEERSPCAGYPRSFMKLRGANAESLKWRSKLLVPRLRKSRVDLAAVKYGSASWRPQLEPQRSAISRQGFFAPRALRERVHHDPILDQKRLKSHLRLAVKRRPGCFVVGDACPSLSAASLWNELASGSKLLRRR